MSAPACGCGRRAHDLPPRWDGLPVEWEGWRTGPRNLCASIGRSAAAPRKCCEACGSRAEQPINRGAARDRDGQLIHGLTVFRCPDCRTDLVWNRLVDEWWLLDDSDYSDFGSVAP